MIQMPFILGNEEERTMRFIIETKRQGNGNDIMEAIHVMSTLFIIICSPLSREITAGVKHDWEKRK